MPLSNRHVNQLLSAAVFASMVAHAARAAEYTVTPAGLYDSSTTVISHTASTTATFTTISLFNPSGALAGSSTRYKPNSTSTAGSNYWAYDPATGLTTVLGLVDDSTTVPAYDPITGNTHTSVTTGNVGTQAGGISAMNTLGEIVGISTLFSNNVNGSLGGSIGTSAWFYAPSNLTVPAGTVLAGTVEIGFISPAADVFSYGYANFTTNAHSSSISGIDNSGHVVGLSSRFQGTAQIGNDPFYYTPGTTTTSATTTFIGLAAPDNPTNANYERSDGTHINTIFGINANGMVAGTTTNYARNASGYSDTFLYTGTGPSIFIGLPTAASGSTTFGAETISQFNTAAVAGGLAQVVTSGFVQNAWVYNINSGATIQVGLTGSVPGADTETGVTATPTYDSSAAATALSGRSSSVTKLNASGHAIGTTNIYTTIGGVVKAGGNDAFYFDGTNTIPIGLTDSVHTANPPQVANVNTYNFRINTPTFLNDSNQVVGTTNRYATASGTTTQKGANAWYYTPPTVAAPLGSTVTIGFVDTASLITSVSHTTFDGLTQSSAVSSLNNSGLAIGTSARYVNATQKGQDGWIYSPTTGTVQLGLVDALHTAADLSASTSVNYLTNSGYAAGTSVRYVAGTSTNNGTDGWFYDSNSKQTFPIVLSTSSTLATSTSLTALTENGILVGTYTKFSGSSTVGTFVFAFTEATGAIDLQLDTTNLGASGLQSLVAMFSASTSGILSGYSALTTSPAYNQFNNRAAYALTPINYTWAGATPATNWSTNANWSGGVSPNGADKSVVIGAAGSATSTSIILSSPQTVGSLTFSNATSNTISGAALTLQATLGNSYISVTGTQTISAPLTFVSNTNLVGTGTLNTGAITNNAAMLVSSIVNTGAITGAGSITVNNATTLAAASINQTGSVSYAGNIKILAHGTPKLASYVGGTLSGTGVLDLTNNDLILAGTSTTDASALISSGKMITSASTINGVANVCTLLVVSGSQYITMHGSATLDDQTVTAGETVVKYAIYGDTTLSGKVNIDDYLAIDNSFARGITAGGWASGDFNGDGSITAADYVLIDRGYAAQGGVNAAGIIALHEAEFGAAYTSLVAVPEPASLAMLSLGILAMCHRRRGSR